MTVRLRSCGQLQTGPAALSAGLRYATPKPQWMPFPQLLYAQVIKTMRRRRLVEVRHRVVFGTTAAVEPLVVVSSIHPT